MNELIVGNGFSKLPALIAAAGQGPRGASLKFSPSTFVIETREQLTRGLQAISCAGVKGRGLVNSGASSGSVNNFV